MALNEACQLWIEQRIDEELKDGEHEKSLRQIGREIADEIERLFEAKVKPITITKRASRAVTNVTPKEDSTDSSNYDEIKQIKREPAKDGTMRGGPRPGAGRKPNAETTQKGDKEEKEKPSFWAMSYADMAISQLKRIRNDDPKREEALRRVKDWVEKNIDS